MPNSSSEEWCAICLCELRVDLVNLPCGHEFHAQCFWDYCAHGTRDTCPLCRQRWSAPSPRCCPRMTDTVKNQHSRCLAHWMTKHAATLALFSHSMLSHSRRRIECVELRSCIFDADNVTLLKVYVDAADADNPFDETEIVESLVRATTAHAPKCTAWMLDTFRCPNLSEAFCHAIEVGALEIVRLIHAKQPAVFDFARRMGENPLERAFRGGDVRCVKFVLAHAPDSVERSVLGALETNDHHLLDSIELGAPSPLVFVDADVLDHVVRCDFIYQMHKRPTDLRRIHKARQCKILTWLVRSGNVRGLRFALQRGMDANNVRIDWIVQSTSQPDQACLETVNVRKCVQLALSHGLKPDHLRIFRLVCLHCQTDWWLRLLCIELPSERETMSSVARLVRSTQLSVLQYVDDRFHDPKYERSLLKRVVRQVLFDANLNCE